METHFPDIRDMQAGVARDRVMTDLKALARDAEVLLRATANDASQKAKAARAQLSAAIEKAKATYGELQAQGIASAKAAAKKTDDTIRSHPYESIGVAFGLGILIGALLKRR